MSEEVIIEVEMRYNGYFKKIKRKNRVVYEGGSMTSFMVDFDKTCLKDLEDDIKSFVKLSARVIVRLAYVYPNSNPTRWVFINNEKEYMEMLEMHLEAGKCRVYLSEEIQGLPIRRMYNSKKLEELLKQDKKDVEIPHFVLEDSEWLKFLQDDEVIMDSLFMTNASIEKEDGIKENIDEAAELTAYSEMKGSTDLQASIGLKSEEVMHSCESHFEKTPQKSLTEELLLLPRRSPRLNKQSTKYIGQCESLLGKKQSRKGKEVMKALLEERISNEQVEVEVEDDLDDCYSQDSYHNLHTSEDEKSDVEVSNIEGLKIKVDKETPIFVVGQTFEDKEHFKLSLRQFAIKEHFEYKFVKNDNVRWVVKCASSTCEWKLRAILMKTDNTTVEIRNLSEKHTCVGINRVGNKQASAKWIARKIVNKVKNNRNVTPKEIQDQIFEDYGIEKIEYGRLWHAREIARQIVFGENDDDYKLVPRLRAELLARNIGSRIEYTTGDDHAFERFFVSFRACIVGFKNGCRTFLGLDGCHLKSKYLGTLISATALDSNNHLLPVAFAVVEGESGSSWKWFLQNLVIALDGEVSTLTVMSDIEKGLEEALKEVIPTAEHRVCMRHLWKSFKKNYPGDFFERTVWEAARSFSTLGHAKALDELRLKSMDAYVELCKKGKDSHGNARWLWSRSTFNTSSKNHYITNNLSESFNAWVLDARGLPVCQLVDHIRVKLMKKIVVRRSQAERWKGVLTPMAERYLLEESKIKNGYQVTRGGNYQYEVTDGSFRRLVDISSKECTCRKWQMTGLPCSHAISVLGGMRNVPWADFVDNYFHKSRYLETYKESVAMLPSKEAWMDLNLDYEVGPPHTKRPRGRPKTKRIRGEGEQHKKSKIPHKCYRCGEWGHHRSTCKNPINVRDISPNRSNSMSKRGKKRNLLRSTQVHSTQETQVHSTQETASSSLKHSNIMDNWSIDDFELSPFKSNVVSTPMKLRDGEGVEERRKRKTLRGRAALSMQ